MSKSELPPDFDPIGAAVLYARSLPDEDREDFLKEILGDDYSTPQQTIQKFKTRSRSKRFLLLSIAGCSVVLVLGMILANESLRDFGKQGWESIVGIFQSEPKQPTPPGEGVWDQYLDKYPPPKTWVDLPPPLNLMLNASFRGSKPDFAEKPQDPPDYLPEEILEYPILENHELWFRYENLDYFSYPDMTQAFSEELESKRPQEQFDSELRNKPQEILDELRRLGEALEP